MQNEIQLFGKELKQYIENITSKKDVELLADNFAKMICENIEHGILDAGKTFVDLRILTDMLTGAVKSDHLKQLVSYQIESADEKKLRPNGNDVVLEESNTGDRYDYSSDPVWLDMDTKVKEAEAAVKEAKKVRAEREIFLKNYARQSYNKMGGDQIVNDDGEIIEPPKLISAGSRVIKLSFKKL